LNGKPGVEELVKTAINQKINSGDILHKGLISGMEIVGDKFSKGEYFVPEMLFSAKAMKAGLKILEPLLVDQHISTIGTVIIGTVEGDMHDIGKNLVAMMLEGAGFKVIDLGVNTPSEKFLSAAKEHPNALIGLSALLTITMEKMRDVIGSMRAAGIPNKVIIGGAPVTERYADEIGASGYAQDASRAVHQAKKILGLA
jgi:5-methyltetrahydrofolate--homocysteine methyltransferase